MRKFWIVLIALGLIAAFSMPASAADVKFSGSYYIQGWYDSNHSLLDTGDASAISGRGAAALYHQRLRVQTEFKVAEGLTLTTRFDALERNWGDRRERNLPLTGYTTPNTSATLESVSRNYSAVVPNSTTAGGIQEQGNIEFERVYITANLPFGQLVAGYANDIQWGTMFLDTVSTRPQIGLYVPVGPVTVIAKIKKDLEGGMNGYNGIGMINNSDKDIYDLAAVFKWKGGEAGLLFEYLNGNMYKTTAAATSWAQTIYGFFPYFKATLGPVFLEGEAYWGGGDYRKFDVAGVNQTLDTYGIYLHAMMDLKPVYFGGIFVYMKGDDPKTLDKVEGSIAAGLVAGQAFTPCLMLWNDPYYTVMGGLAGRTTAAVANNISTQFMDNTTFFQLYVGVKPTPKWDIVLKGAYATAEQKPIGYVSADYGYEFDLSATYKIYDNLSYMIAGGYLVAGDYFKGTDAGAKLSNDYMVMHQLTLTF